MPGFASAGSISVAGGAVVAVQLGGWAQADIDSLRTIASIPAGASLGLDTTNGNATYSGAIPSIGIGGAGGLAKVGANAVCLTGANSYTGGTTVLAGGLEAKTTSSLPGFASPGAVSVASGATVAVPLDSWAQADIDSLRICASIPAGAYLGLDTTNGSFTYSGAIAGVGSGGAGGSNKLGGNTLCLAGSNSYTGGTVLAGGELSVAPTRT